MTDIHYTKEHEYIIVNGDEGVVGISNHAQEQLGDIVYIETPEAGKTCKKNDEIATVESVKAASEVYAPVSGEVIEGNGVLNDNPALVNSDPEGAGWFLKIKISDKSELETLMNAEGYAKYLEEIS